MYKRQLHNDPAVANRAHTAFSKMLGKEIFVPVEKMMLGEDFSNYQKKVPSAFGFVGGGKLGKTNFPNHHPCFDIDERGIAFMAKCYGAYVLEVFSS